ncbi:Uma2 family endonuclease [Planctomicrobium piriforme]|uniref:Endonuclease, Uma2 family (Restriction endonuclease fold) n=1 Tax=Planctomicrobium piriforme TaxID=1576369 RepID=A0A1I3D4M4_9PLAN|nr:Uma2 family endonuclease [Planctomicrobium piriforme]SFH81703.1 Endonuclease, Uma2 family (restriction endonuclease fold) [Planctomicrobium piriforme]
MPTQTGLITAEQFVEMHFEVPVELVRGEIVYLYGEDGMTRPGWKHGIVCVNVAAVLWQWARPTRAGIVTSNDTGVITERDPDTLRGPDVFFVAAGKVPAGPAPKGVPEITPDLCVEVLSPSDRWQRVRHKVMEYLDRGVSEVWVLDSEKHTVHIFRDDDSPSELKLGDTLMSPVLPGFECRIDEFFEGA